MGAALAADPCATPDRRDLSGALLVAAPAMQDPHFSHTIVFIARHTEEGAFGLVVNRPLGSTAISTLLEATGAESEGVAGELRIHYGGPVEPELGFILHSADYADETTVAVDEDHAVTSGIGILRAIAEGTGPRRKLFVLGYAGWGAGQLEAEIRRGDWSAVPADDALIFDDDPRSWEQALSRSCYSI